MNLPPELWFMIFQFRRQMIERDYTRWCHNQKQMRPWSRVHRELRQMVQMYEEIIGIPQGPIQRISKWPYYNFAYLWGRDNASYWRFMRDEHEGCACRLEQRWRLVWYIDVEFMSLQWTNGLEPDYRQICSNAKNEWITLDGFKYPYLDLLRRKM